MLVDEYDKPILDVLEPVLEEVRERIDEILEEWSTRTTGTLVHRVASQPATPNSAK